jgi:hypothetical protein
LMSGYLIQLNANNKGCEYHAGGGDYVFYCENPIPPL